MSICGPESPDTLAGRNEFGTISSLLLRAYYDCYIRVIRGFYPRFQARAVKIVKLTLLTFGCVLLYSLML